LKKAASTSLGHCSRGTRRLWRLRIANSASRPAPTTPVVPRRMSGGSSLRRYLVTGQLKPQPTEVMAKNMRPAGVM
jgi:hypothetical protein